MVFCFTHIKRANIREHDNRKSRGIVGERGKRRSPNRESDVCGG